MKNKKATIRDVAKEAGVSVATVSRFINNISYISPETEQKIKVVMKKLDYKPNEIARGLAKQKSKTKTKMDNSIMKPKEEFAFDESSKSKVMLKSKLAIE